MRINQRTHKPPYVSRMLYHFSDRASIRNSLNILTQLIYRDSLNPVVHTMAVKIMAPCGSSWNCKVDAMHRFLKKRFRYRDDPADRDQFKSAVIMAHEIMQEGYFRGDCDDATVMAGALFKSVGFIIKVIALSNEKRPDAELDHVALILVAPNGWEVYFDLTIDFLPKLENRNVLKSDII